MENPEAVFACHEKCTYLLKWRKSIPDGVEHIFSPTTSEVNEKRLIAMMRINATIGWFYKE